MIDHYEIFLPQTAF